MALRDPSLVPDKTDQKGLIDYFVSSLGTAAGIPIAIVLINWFVGDNIRANLDAITANEQAIEQYHIQKKLTEVENTRYWKARADKEAAGP
jgi:hypothetical protein